MNIIRLSFGHGYRCNDPSPNISVFIILKHEITKMPFEVKTLTFVDRLVMSREIHFLGVSL